MSIWIPDPENDPEEEAYLTYRLQQSIHLYEPGPNYRCVAEVAKYCYEHKTIDFHNPCDADSWSVLHYDEEADFRELHDHGGGDCMCFEGRDQNGF